MKLKISTELSFPESAVTSTILIYGGKGMGKTNFGAVLLEEFSHAGLRWAAIDPMGVLWGLRHSLDGKGSGVECLILGGVHGDIPIEPTGGAVVADLVANENVNVIIDISRKINGEMWAVAERIRFMTDYGKQLYKQQGSLIDGKRRDPLFQMIDEAARFMPQTVRSGELQVAMCMGVWAAIVEEGRNVGLGVGLLTQRSARLNKDVAELADVMMAFRTVGPNSINAVMDWMGEHVPKEKIKGYIESLRSLPRGTCMVVSPGWLNYEGIVPIRARETFDSSATPKAGERLKKVSGRGAAPDLGKYSARMRETIERIKEDDPKALKQTIRDLNSQLVTAKSAKPQIVEVPVKTKLRPDPEAIAKIREDLVADVQGELTRIARLIAKDVCEAIADLQTLAKSVEEPKRWSINAKTAAKVEKALSRVDLVPFFPDSGSPLPPPRAQAASGAQSPVSRPPSAPSAPIGDFSDSQTKIIQALADGITIGRRELTRTWTAFLAGMSPKSSGFEKNLSTLRTRGVVDYGQGSTVFLTQEGRKLVTHSTNYTEAELHAKIAQMVSSSQARLLGTLIGERGNLLTRDELAERCDVSAKSSGFEKNLSSLRSLKLIDYAAGSTVFAVNDLFLDDRP